MSSRLVSGDVRTKQVLNFLKQNPAESTVGSPYGVVSGQLHRHRTIAS